VGDLPIAFESCTHHRIVLEIEYADGFRRHRVGVGRRVVKASEQLAAGRVEPRQFESAVGSVGIILLDRCHQLKRVGLFKPRRLHQFDPDVRSDRARLA